MRNRTEVVFQHMLAALSSSESRGDVARGCEKVGTIRALHRMGLVEQQKGLKAF